MPGEFDDLDVHKQARVLRQRVLNLARQLPKEERFVLVPQTRRAALSVTNSIAEGHGSRRYRHNISYLYRSRASVNELLDDVGVCEDEGYFRKEHLDDLRQQAKSVIRLINGYVAYLRKRLDEQSNAQGRPQRNPDRPTSRSTD